MILTPLILILTSLILILTPGTVASNPIRGINSALILILGIGTGHKKSRDISTDTDACVSASLTERSIDCQQQHVLVIITWGFLDTSMVGITRDY